MSLPPPKENSAIVAARVAAAREVQRDRYRDSQIRCNAQAEGEILTRFSTPDAKGQALLTEAAERLRLSARGYTRMVRVARTLADLDGSEAVGRIHVAEALSYRRIGRTA
jgi:magnesium chelatase family protein